MKGFKPGFAIWTDCRSRDGVHRAAHPAGQLVNTSQHVNGSHSGDLWGVCAAASPGLVTLTVPFRDTPAGRHSLFIPLTPWDSGSGRMPREPLDAPENLPKEAECQKALGQLDTVPSSEQAA